MIKVYFETKTYCELIAVFKDSEIYNACYSTLDILRKNLGYDIITESVEEIDLDELIK